ncbi:hypothetical protein AHQ86_12120 [Salmonella enterica subsp. enterica]|nr:hypothetical protein [Salmonella enterica subsp. enterica serovar Chicago]MIF17469.1 hypothetical protein [Salmonella enterica subsp. enterica serovar Lexington]
MNSKVFTVHQPFTTQHIDFYKQKYAVNSVNSFSKKSFFLDVIYSKTGSLNGRKRCNKSPLVYA